MGHDESECSSAGCDTFQLGYDRFTSSSDLSKRSGFRTGFSVTWASIISRNRSGEQGEFLIKRWIRANRHRLEEALADSPRRRFFSPVYYSQYQVTLPLIQKFAKGRLIDLGCGDMPFRQLLVDRISAYHSMDLYPRNSPITFIGDIQNMPVTQDKSYDTAICLEVLEHVPDPFQAIREIYRILKPDGILILSVPHLNRLHDEPYDYYRFTRYGVQYLLEQGGFAVLALEKRGGLFSFLGHQISTVLLGIVWGIPILEDVIWFLNSWLVTRTCYKIDQWLDRAGIFAAGYSAVACKERKSNWDSELSRGERPR